MIRRSVIAVVILAAMTAPIRAELKYTMRTEAHPSTVKSTTPPNPLLTMLSSIVLGAIAPPGGLEATVTIGDRGTRVEYSKAYTVVPAGGAILMGPDGMLTVLDPATKTYWKTPVPQSMAALGVSKPTIDIKKTGEFDTISGVRAERATLTIKMPLPIQGGGMGMPGLPAEMSLSGEGWFSDQYRSYAQKSSALGAMAGSAGLADVSDAGFLMRSILRSELFGNQEVESVVSAIREEPVPASAFEIPDGYKEVQPQLGGRGRSPGELTPR